MVEDKEEEEQGVRGGDGGSGGEEKFNRGRQLAMGGW